jgi:hypothetical protein
MALLACDCCAAATVAAVAVCLQAAVAHADAVNRANPFNQVHTISFRAQPQCRSARMFELSVQADPSCCNARTCLTCLAALTPPC